MNPKHLSLLLLAAFLATHEATAQSGRQVPKLVVLLTVDQLRSDYLEAFSPLYGEDGLKKMLKEGMVYTNVSYPFSPVDRASAVAAIHSGTTPYYNGITGERWFNRKTLRPMTCIDGEPTIPRQLSPSNLCVSTLGDELKVSTDGKAVVYAIAPSADAAILSAGHAANGALWIDDATGRWTTSSYYKSAGSTWISAINSVLSPAASADKLTWEAINPLTANFSYFLSGGMQKPFRHTFTGMSRFRDFKTSGLIKEHITEASLQCIPATGMGVDAIPDLLSITYFAGNFMGRSSSACRMEIQDTYVRLDRTIAHLISEIEQRVGAGNTLFLLTSTGHCQEECTDYSAYGVPGGTLSITRTANLLNMYLGALWGMGNYVEATFGAQLFLNHQLLEQKKVVLTEAMQRSREFLSQLSGITNVYSAQQLLNEMQEQTMKIRNGFHPTHNGDIIIEVAPGWNLVNEDTQEQHTSRLSFIAFPLIIYGPDIRPERVASPVSVVRIAPTLTKCLRIRAPNGCKEEPLF